jgi:hypothetical protein
MNKGNISAIESRSDNTLLTVDVNLRTYGNPNHSKSRRDDTVLQRNKRRPCGACRDMAGFSTLLRSSNNK